MRFLIPVLAAGAVLLVACGGGGGGSSPVNSGPTSTPTATPTPVSSAAPGQVSVAPATLSFLSVGAAAAQAVSASQPNNTGGFSASGCTGIVTTTVSAGTVTVTPVAAGTCTLSVAGSAGQAAPISINVTTTSVSGQ